MPVAETKKVITGPEADQMIPQSTGRPESLQIDITEKGRSADGKQISLDRRLFMQFVAFGGCENLDQIKARIESNCPQAVLYQDINDPLGIGVLSFSENPTYIPDTIHPLLRSEEFAGLVQKHELSMMGRTYSIGYESDLEDVLIRRPIQRVCDPDTPWVVWYPVRRSGAFERESREEQRKMLMEHGGIGHAYGKAGYAMDIRLAGHGMNSSDCDFIVGLLGKHLFPLSALVQHMRRTRQTSEFIESMGPFFVGRAIWQPKPELKW
jgi:chlorite dismutase